MSTETEIFTYLITVKQIVFELYNNHYINIVVNMNVLCVKTKFRKYKNKKNS